MFDRKEPELSKLQEQLDRERELLERARKIEEAHTQPEPPKFAMRDLYATIPGNDYGPMRIDSYRP
jgi:hypothetical protein